MSEFTSTIAADTGKTVLKVKEAVASSANDSNELTTKLKQSKGTKTSKSNRIHDQNRGELSKPERPAVAMRVFKSLEDGLEETEELFGDWGQTSVSGR